MSKEYQIKFRTPAQKTIQAALDSMDIRGISRRNVSLNSLTVMTGIITTDNPKNATEYEENLRQEFKDSEYELISVEAL